MVDDPGEKWSYIPEEILTNMVNINHINQYGVRHSPVSQKLLHSYLLFFQSTKKYLLIPLSSHQYAAHASASHHLSPSHPIYTHPPGMFFAQVT